MKKVAYGVVFLFLAFILYLVIASILEPEYGVYDLGNGCTYFEEIRCIECKGDSLVYDVPPKVLSFINEKGYILVKQHPKEFPDVMFAPCDYPYGRDTIYYWLIDKHTKELHGPMLCLDMRKLLEEKELEININQLE